MPAEFISSPESLDALGEAIAAGLILLDPPPRLTVSEWADRYAVLSQQSSAQPGPWSTATAEYQRGFMDAGSDPSIQRIVAMWGAQTGKTAGLLNINWYYVHHDPSPILMVQPTLEAAENFSKERIAPAIRDTPALTPLFGDPRAKDSGNTLLSKEFPGGGMALAGANSPAGLASRARRIASFDEVDKFEDSAGSEGDPVKLGEIRTATFWNRKIILTSTPSIKGVSRIEREFEKSDKRYYFVPCPHCGEEQMLQWENLKWPKDDNGRPVLEDCYYVCAVSGCEIRETEKPQMIRKGEWRATATSVDGKTAGFHLNALYSPWVTWPEVIQKWLDAQGSPTELQTFVNAYLAETWELQGDKVEQSVLQDRVHPYAAQAPDGVLVITAAVDVQKDRLEASAIGWGRGEESWAIDHRVFEGDPSRTSVWEDLDQWLDTEYQHESGIRLRIRCTMIDSGGHHTKQVYAFTKPRQHRRIYACKGRGGNHPLLARPSKQGTIQALLYMVGVDSAKELFYARLKNDQEGPGHCHFPDIRSDEDASVKGQFDEEFFAQTTAEQLVTTGKPGHQKRVWIKRRPRNEALDLRVYNMAALERIRPNFPAIGKGVAREAARVKERQMEESKPEETPEPDSGQAAAYDEHQESERKKTLIERSREQKIIERSSRRRRGGWLNAWR